MQGPLARLRALDSRERRIAAYASGWFFLVIATLWLLKPVRSAALLANLGAEELPYVRLGAVVVVGLVVMAYSWIVRRLSRLAVACGASLVFAAVLVLFWIALVVGESALGRERWFVWSVFILVDVYSTVMVGIFWIYINDVVTPREADALYGPIGVGGILGGVAGGALVDSLVSAIGPVHVLLFCALLGVACAALVTRMEHVLAPPPRGLDPGASKGGLASALAGAHEVVRSRYLLLIVGVVIGYEFAAAMTDFVVNVVFERTFTSEVVLAKMFGRLGWIVSATALVSQLVLVPVLLPTKRVALLVPPIVMAAAAVGLSFVPVVAMAILLSAADRGLNYSLQQSAKETLYVPLTDAQRYQGKAFIDMLVDRVGKALSALALIAVIALAGMSVAASLAVALAAMVVWGACAAALGRAYARAMARQGER